MDEVRAHSTRAVLVQVHAFFLNAGQAADARPDRDSGAQPRRLVHVGEAGVFERLSRGVDPVNDEWIDLPLRLVVDALRRIEAIFVIRPASPRRRCGISGRSHRTW